MLQYIFFAASKGVRRWGGDALNINRPQPPKVTSVPYGAYRPLLWPHLTRLISNLTPYPTLLFFISISCFLASAASAITHYGLYRIKWGRYLNIYVSGYLWAYVTAYIIMCVLRGNSELAVLAPTLSQI